MDKKTIDRIRKNEERLDNINNCIKNVENALEEFKKNKKILICLISIMVVLIGLKTKKHTKKMKFQK